MRQNKTASDPFQDRCLKPLGHPSVDNIEYLRIAAGITNVNVAAELPALALNLARADVRYLGPGGLILNKRGAPRKARAIDGWARARTFPGPGHLRTCAPKKKNPAQARGKSQVRRMSGQLGDWGNLKAVQPALLA